MRVLDATARFGIRIPTEVLHCLLLHCLLLPCLLLRGLLLRCLLLRCFPACWRAATGPTLALTVHALSLATHTHGCAPLPPRPPSCRVAPMHLQLLCGELLMVA